MSGPFAIGLGCRRGYPGEAIAALVRQALAAWPTSTPMPPQPPVLATLDRKRDEAGLHAASAILGLRLVFLSEAALAETEPRVSTFSERVRARFGIASVAEAAALSAAGPRSTLVVPRLSDGGATCAIAATIDGRGDPT